MARQHPQRYRGPQPRAQYLNPGSWQASDTMQGQFRQVLAGSASWILGMNAGHTHMWSRFHVLKRTRPSLLL